MQPETQTRWEEGEEEEEGGGCVHGRGGRAGLLVWERQCESVPVRLTPNPRHTHAYKRTHTHLPTVNTRCYWLPLRANKEVAGAAKRKGGRLICSPRRTACTSKCEETGGIARRCSVRGEERRGAGAVQRCLHFLINGGEQTASSLFCVIPPQFKCLMCSECFVIFAMWQRWCDSFIDASVGKSSFFFLHSFRWMCFTK